MLLRSPESTTIAPGAANGTGNAGPAGRVVRIPPLATRGVLHVPDAATGFVVLATHASCALPTARLDRIIAALHAAGLGTLSVDVLLPHEARSRHKAFDRTLIASRLGRVLDWLATRPCTRALPIGLFAVGSGAAVALTTAVVDHRVAALVMADGRLDLAGGAPMLLETPTLLVTGAADAVIAGINRRVHALMRCERALVVLQGHAQACDRAAALDVTIALAGDWFRTHLRVPEPAQADHSPLRSATAADSRQRCGRVAQSAE
jgi:putative phosphoribosyl transferase